VLPECNVEVSYPLFDIQPYSYGSMGETTNLNA